MGMGNWIRVLDGDLDVDGSGLGAYGGAESGHQHQYTGFQNFLILATSCLLV